MRLTVLTVADMALPQLANAQEPVGTAFTYQGLLTNGGVPIPDQEVDLVFTLWDALADGNEIASSPAQTEPVQSGVFTALVDSDGQVFTGDACWLEISVRIPHDASDAQPIVFDGRNVYDLSTMRRAWLEYHPIGKPVVRSST
jgi:hypothetical protein